MGKKNPTKTRESSPVKQESIKQENCQAWALSLSVQLLQGPGSVGDTTAVTVSYRKVKPGCGQGQASKIPTYLFLQTAQVGFNPLILNK